jgi:hypothetical protein
MTPTKISAESENLIAFLVAASEEGRERLSYVELSHAAGVDVTDEGRGYLNTARNRVQMDRGDVWGTERTVGLYLVPHNERARSHERAATKVRGVVRRTKKVMNTVKTTDLNAEAIEAFNTGQTRIMLIEAAASKRVVRRVEAAVKDEKGVIGPMKLDDALAFLRKAQPKKKVVEEVRPEGDPRP